MNQKGFMNLVLIGVLTVLIATVAYFVVTKIKNGQFVGERNGHKLIRVQRCSDYCPKEIMNKSWSVEYAEGTTAQKCRDIGGYPRMNPAFGGYWGCSPDPVDAAFLYTEDLSPKVPNTQGVVNTSNTGTLSGKVLVGPICPVEREGEVCKASPEVNMARQVGVFKSQGQEMVLVTSTHLDANGNYSFNLSPGNYEIRASGMQVDKLTATIGEVVIKADQTTTLNFNIDTGIR
jgi:hypothetical protein